MTVILLAAAGAAVGLVLDQLVARLAVRPHSDEEGDAEDPGDEEGAPEPAPGAPRLEMQSEAGTLAVAASPAREWTQRLAIVASTAGLFAAAGARYEEPWHLAIVTTYICVFVVCGATDALSYRVPNVVTYPAMLGALVVGAVVPGADHWEVLAGGAFAGGLLFIPALLTGGAGMGMGDVKLATVLGLALGFRLAVPAMVLMALGGGLAALVILVARRRGRREPIPYAPFISIGALAVMLLQGTAFVDIS